VRRHALLAVLSTALAACSLLVSTGDLSNGPDDTPHPDATPEADVPKDAGQDTTPSNDAHAEAQADADTTYRDTVMSDSPLSYWRFSETSGTTAKDETGAHAGTYTDTYTLGQPGPLPGDTAVALAGGSIDVGVVYGFEGRSAFSIEAWAMPTVLDTGYRNIYSRVSNTAVARNGHFLWARQEGLAVERNQDFAFHDGGLQDSCGSTSPIPLSKWSHVVVTYDGTDMRMFIDAALVDRRASPASLSSTPATFRIGSSVDVGSSWVGSLDEIAVYGVALPIERVAAHYHAAGR
jgi:hypothetical protein